MLTRCPACQTTFRVSPEQLSARNGMVRCGHCRAPFNALAHLRLEEDSAKPEAPLEPTQPAGPLAPTQPAAFEETPPASPAAAQPASPPGITLGELTFWLPPEPDTAERPDSAEQALPTPPPELVSISLEDDEALPPPVPPSGVVNAPERAAVELSESLPAPIPEPTPTQPGSDAPAPDSVPPPRYSQLPAETETPENPLVFRRTRRPAPHFEIPSAPPAEEEQREPPPGTEIPRSDPPVVHAEPSEHPETAAALTEVAPEEADAAEAPDWSHYKPVAPNARRSPVLVLLTLLAFLALAAQTVFLLREPITRWVPGLRAPLEEACARLGCNLPLARQIQAITILSSDLRPVEGKPRLFKLETTLRNNAGYIQAFPALELSLTDTADRMLVRRVFTPAEWLPQGQRQEAGMPAHAELSTQINFEVHDADPSGYKLYAFYP